MTTTMSSFETVSFWIFVAVGLAIAVRVGLLVYRYSPRVGAVIVASLPLPWTTNALLIESFLISVAATVVATAAAWHFLLRPIKAPLVWYVTFWASLIGGMVTWAVIGPSFLGAPRLNAVVFGLVQGIRAGSCMGLIIFAIRGPVHDPADDEPPGFREQVRSLRLLLQRTRSWLQRA